MTKIQVKYVESRIIDKDNLMNFSREKNIIEIKEEYKRENESSY
jgi:hypothetical protein